MLNLASISASLADENGASTREGWLLRAVDHLRPAFEQHACPVPKSLHVSVGFPSVGAVRRRKPRIGECWAPQASADGCPQLFISPLLGEPVEVLGVLVHELIHAAVGMAAGHGPRFRRPALAIGLCGRMTATRPGAELSARLEDLSRTLGRFPHAGLDAGLPRKKQSTRLLKVACPACGYLARIAGKWIAEGLPTCPCGALMGLTD